ncbi:hypothetical protein IKE_02178 [Bacillus cereus VD196]|uniref:Uncharacterized protein n=1 Tax=Bacillus cereus VD196 TaxID=1053243 RepID=A0A9W5Q479_BACCE|nr:hypothetical protein IKE_02178 [Bacillus cereus VD196]
MSHELKAIVLGEFWTYLQFFNPYSLKYTHLQSKGFESVNKHWVLDSIREEHTI